jgi:hypothetical protein
MYKMLLHIALSSFAEKSLKPVQENLILDLATIIAY